jgi:hypothetical protein
MDRFTDGPPVGRLEIVDRRGAVDGALIPLVHVSHVGADRDRERERPARPGR